MIYLIHFDQALGSEKHQAKHYLGFVEGDDRNLAWRLIMHRGGWGARILEACNIRSINYEVVATFPGDRNRERQIKNWKKHRLLCPICSPVKAPRPFSNPG